MEKCAGSYYYCGTDQDVCKLEYYLELTIADLLRWPLAACLCNFCTCSFSLPPSAPYTHTHTLTQSHTQASDECARAKNLGNNATVHVELSCIREEERKRTYLQAICSGVSLPLSPESCIREEERKRTYLQAICSGVSPPLSAHWGLQLSLSMRNLTTFRCPLLQYKQEHIRSGHYS